MKDFSLWEVKKNHTHDIFVKEQTVIRAAPAV